jgi:hypothetical protein
MQGIRAGVSAEISGNKIPGDMIKGFEAPL